MQVRIYGYKTYECFVFWGRGERIYIYIYIYIFLKKNIIANLLLFFGGLNVLSL